MYSIWYRRFNKIEVYRLLDDDDGDGGGDDDDFKTSKDNDEKGLS